jgi:hypothetical protein
MRQDHGPAISVGEKLPGTEKSGPLPDLKALLEGWGRQCNDVTAQRTIGINPAATV